MIACLTKFLRHDHLSPAKTEDATVLPSSCWTTPCHVPVPFFSQELLTQRFGVEVEIVTDVLEGKEPRAVSPSHPLDHFRGRARTALRRAKKSFLKTGNRVLQDR